MEEAPKHHDRKILLTLILFLLIELAAFPLSANMTTPSDIVARIDSAYQAVQSYQCEMEVREYRRGALHETKKFIYSFQKPHHLRIDMESPHRGTVLIYPDREGKVLVKPGGLPGFMKLHLAPESSVLQSESGQRIDQTDLGQLIAHISRSVTDGRKGEVTVSAENGRVVLETVAQDPFKARTVLRYRFFIDKTLWLPVEVIESTEDGVLAREAFFRKLRTGVTFPEHFFDTE